jgi:V/A-type H+-transporting ATPase subunit A
MKDAMAKGAITKVSGTLATAEVAGANSGDFPLCAFETARVGRKGLWGEVVRVRESKVDIQVLEDTTGLSVGEEVLFTGELLSVDLGPGFLGEVLDGLGRSLIPPLLSRAEKEWHFTPSAEKGETLVPGDVVGTVVENGRFLHRILAPANLIPIRGSFACPRHSTSESEVEWIAPEGNYKARDRVCRLTNGLDLTLTQRWAVRVARPIKARLPLNRLLSTGQRVVDDFFPLALGGSAVLSGGVGTGKATMQRSFIENCPVDLVVYIACGTRGNELAGLLEEFSKPDAPSMERIVVIANGMPTASREPGVCLGMTLAEHYRDMGYDALVVIDSISRWAESYPAYLESRISRCYERAGRVERLGTPSKSEEISSSPPSAGSVTVIGSTSPAGGNFSEPVTQAALRSAGAFWALSENLARAHRFPALDERRSHSLYAFLQPNSPNSPNLPNLRNLTQTSEDAAS